MFPPLLIAPKPRSGLAQLTANVTTSNTSYEDISGLSFTLAAPFRAKILIYLHGIVASTQVNQQVFFRADVDGADQTQEVIYELTQNLLTLFTVTGLITVAAGTHTVKAQWKNPQAGGVLISRATTSRYFAQITGLLIPA